MRSMHLQPVMNDKLRIAVPKEKVNGWKHTSAYGIHIFTRGHIGYILTPDDEKGAMLEKFDYKHYKYLDVYDYDTEFKKFYDIKVVDAQ